MPSVVQVSPPDYVSHWSTFRLAVQDDGDWDSGSEITGMSARCWPGELTERDSQISSGDYIQVENMDVSSDEPFGFYGSVSMSDYREYSCEWGFQTSGEIPTSSCEGEGFLEGHLVGCGRTHEMHEDPNNEEFSGFKNEYGVEPSGSTSQLSNWDSVVSAH